MVKLSPGIRGLIIGVIIIVIVGGASFLFLTGRIGFSPLPCGGPCPGKEALFLESYQVNTPTNMTLTIVNTGVASTYFVSYSVKSAAGQVYSNGSWSEPSFGPNDRLAVNIVIDGIGFTFQSGSSYTVTIGTARNNEFVFFVTT